jgi:hypothetical protein
MRLPLLCPRKARYFMPWTGRKFYVTGLAKST